MPSVARLGDATRGHGGYPPTVSVSGSPNVYVNGKAAVRQGDGFTQHCTTVNNERVCHGVSAGSGSGKVFVNGKAIFRTNDSTACGDTQGNGSSNVFAN